MCEIMYSWCVLHIEHVLSESCFVLKIICQSEQQSIFEEVLVWILSPNVMGKNCDLKNAKKKIIIIIWNCSVQ